MDVPFVVAVSPAGMEGIEMALVPVQEIASVALTVPAIFRVPVRRTAAVGAHFTTALQFAPGAMLRVFVQVVETRERSLPLTVAAAESTRGAVPLLDTDTGRLALLPTF